MSDHWPNARASIWLTMPNLEAELIACVERKMSAGEAANHMSLIAGRTMTRNACIAKARRLGRSFLSKPPHERRQRSLRKPRIARVTEPKAKAPPSPLLDVPFIEKDFLDGKPSPADLATPLEQRKLVLELGSKHCRFPIGDPRSADFFFCGDVPMDGSSYCVRHSARCFKRDKAA